MSSETLYASSPCRKKKKKSTAQCYCRTSAPPKPSSELLLKVWWEALEAAWQEAAEIKDKMKGREAQRNEYGKC